MKRIVLVVLFLLLYPSWLVHGQQSGGLKLTIQGGVPAQATEETKEQPGQPLTNESIVKLVKAGLGDDTIISTVNTQPGKYSLGVEDVIALKKAGVSEKIITAMLNKSASAPTPSPEGPAATTNASDQSYQPLASQSLSGDKGDIPPIAQLPCSKVVSFGYMAPTPQGPRLIQYNIPDGTSKGWLNNWVRKNAKDYPDACFLPGPMQNHANFMVVLSNSPSSFHGFEAVTTTATSTTPVSGSGTVTNNYGEMWNFTYEGEVATTTTTRQNVPYEINTNILYANAYRDDGALVSQHRHVYSTQTGGSGASALGYNMVNLFRATDARGRLITSVMQDIAGPARKKAKSN